MVRAAARHTTQLAKYPLDVATNGPWKVSTPAPAAHHTLLSAAIRVSVVVPLATSACSTCGLKQSMRSSTMAAMRVIEATASPYDPRLLHLYLALIK